MIGLALLNEVVLLLQLWLPSELDLEILKVREQVQISCACTLYSVNSINVELNEKNTRYTICIENKMLRAIDRPCCSFTFSNKYEIFAGRCNTYYLGYLYGIEYGQQGQLVQIG